MVALPRIILCDLDNTICVPRDSDDPAVKYGQAVPIVDVIEQLRRARAMGFKIVIYTARGMLTMGGDVDEARRYAEPWTLEWLAQNDVPYDRIQWGKPSSCVIFDDLALHPGRMRVWLDAWAEKPVSKEPPPVDRTRVESARGGPIKDDHRELKDNGQQRDYVVLSADERSRGFVRPYRDAYRHLSCGEITTMSRPIAETYARDPFFYSGTFCSTCKKHFPVGEDGEFTWYEMDGSEGPKVGT